MSDNKQFLSFDWTVNEAVRAIGEGQVKRACLLMDDAVKLAVSKEQRKRLHDLGNEIQVAIFAEYMATTPVSGVAGIELS